MSTQFPGPPNTNTNAGWEREPYTIEEVKHQLYDWRTRLNEARDGTGVHGADEAACLRMLDHWLDELSEVRGR